MFPDDRIVGDAYTTHHGCAQPFDSFMQDETSGYFTTGPVDQSPVDSWYDTANPSEHMGYEPSTPLSEPDHAQSGRSMTTSSMAPNGYFDLHNTGWFPKPPSLCKEERAAVSDLAVQQQQQQQQQLDMQYEKVGPFDGSSCHQPPHLSHRDYECSQFYDCVAATGTKPLQVSQHHSFAPTYSVDCFQQFMSDPLLAASHSSHSIDLSCEERPAYQSTPDQTNHNAQEYEHHESFDMVRSYPLSAATETIHLQPPTFNSSSSSLAGACPIAHLPCLSLGPAPRQHINTDVYPRLRDCIDYHQYSSADKAFAPASALAQEMTATMIVRIVPSQHAAPPSRLTAAPAAFESSSRHSASARGPAEQIGRCQYPHVASHVYVSPHETYHVPTLAALTASQHPFSNEANLSIDPRQLQPVEHPCANSYDPHAPSLRNNLRTRAKSLERILLEAAEPTNEAAVKSVLSEQRHLHRKAPTRMMLVEWVRQQIPVTTAAPEDSSTGNLVIRLEDASSPPPPSPSATRKRTGKKRVLACHFCRVRKIACGSSRSRKGDETCNQCARRSLTCIYPTKSYRGMRKKMLLSLKPNAKIRARTKGTKKNVRSPSAAIVPESDRVELTPVPS